MHEIEPHFAWEHLYSAALDGRSPFYGNTYSEFEYSNQIYNYYIHPQWDDIGSTTLFIKILFADYEEHYAIVEMIGEWNDAINNDIMILKRDIIDLLIHEGINKFILIGEHVLNFHSSDDSYYEEWFEDVEDGWIVFLGGRAHVLAEFKKYNLDYYINFGGELETLEWRTFKPHQLHNKIDKLISKRLNT
jgi:hypothetical protein